MPGDLLYSFWVADEATFSEVRLRHSASPSRNYLLMLGLSGKLSPSIVDQVIRYSPWSCPTPTVPNISLTPL